MLKPNTKWFAMAAAVAFGCGGGDGGGADGGGVLMEEIAIHRSLGSGGTKNPFSAIDSRRLRRDL